MCLYPTLIKNKKYQANKKNGGNIPAVSDKRVLYVPVACGKCMECKKKKSRDWQVRLLEDSKHIKNGKFVTFTFSNESISKLHKDLPIYTNKNKRKLELDGYDRDNAIAKLGVRRFLEKWRKKHKKSVRHWFITELGHEGTENIHLHGIIWTDHEEDIDKIWDYGFTWVQEKEKNINESIVNYITKYINKVDFEHKEYNPIILCSKGIGAKYLETFNKSTNKYKKNETNEAYTTRSGHKIMLPIYYRNHIYNEEEREKLWLEKLDKETRYVGGEKIKIDKSEENYYKTLEFYRNLNKQLGYGDNEINWDRKNYENERRNMLFKERTKKEEIKYYIEPTIQENKLPQINQDEAF